MLKNRYILLIVLSTVFHAAYADTWVPTGAHVTQIATSQLYAQNAVIFVLDKGASDCAAGQYISYYPRNTDELKTMYATVLASYLAGTPLLVHFASGCTTDSINVGT